ncbi:MAG TPA: hypothetical protein VGG89_13140 [Candidatus Baltobacteraceae bacterium]
MAYFLLLLAACVAAVWPVLWSGTIPAFQQDWTWPLARPQALQWLHSFAGLWDDRSLGHANALPWQSYAVVTQAVSILVFGPSAGLAVWLCAVLFAAACTCTWMLGSLGVRSRLAAFAGALFYATTPVVFTRVAAGHLAYLLAYALLPAVVVLARRTLEQRRWSAAILLGLAIGFAASQIQFLAIVWLAIVPLAFFATRAEGWFARLAAALGIAIAVQLQCLLPLALGSTANPYAAQRALLSFEYNNSSPFADAVVMLGYFTHYYETAAPPWAYAVLYGIVAVAIVLGIAAARRFGSYAVVLFAIGVVLTAGLYGPLSAPLAFAFGRSALFTVFRDLHYFAAITAIGVALAIGLALERFRLAALPLLLAIVWTAVPVLAGKDLRGLLVPRHDVAETVDQMQFVHARGAGRVLWLPAEEPLGIKGAPNVGRDFSAYGLAGNPSVSDDLDNPQLAYALATLRDGRPNWKAFASVGVRYVVYRSYVRSARELDNLGTGFRLAYGTVDDAALGRLLGGARRLIPIRRDDDAVVYELTGALPVARPASADSGALLYSELGADDVAVARTPANVLSVAPSLMTADPRLDWVEGRLGWRYRAWLPDSIYPFVWTVSKQTLAFAVPPAAKCVLAASIPYAFLQVANATDIVDGPWQRVSVLGKPATVGARVTASGGVTAIGSRGCLQNAASDPVFVMASGYDTGWRALDGTSLVAPAIANGWMMAWPASLASSPKIYLPAIAQVIGTIAGWAAIVASYLAARRRDRVSPEAISIDERSAVPQL